ncbi:hypothetical protein HZS_7324, partial [Henneguya salminicola]
MFKPASKYEYHIKGPIPSEQHPLQQQWSFWFNKRIRNQGFGTKLEKVDVTRTVEEFWSLYNNIHHPSELQHCEDYSFFKHNVSPQWEDPKNENGGRWIFSIPIKVVEKDKLEKDIYLHLLLILIGDTFGQDTEIINGITCGVRKDELKFNIWTNVIEKKVDEL